MQNQPYKMCPACQQPAVLDAQTCTRCGHRYRTRFSTPPQSTQAFGVQPPPQQTQAFGVQPPPYTAPPQPPPYYGPPPVPIQELARRYREARNTFNWTLLGGLFCLWPLWIITYLEHCKMRDIKRDVGLMGIDADAWVSTL